MNTPEQNQQVLVEHIVNIDTTAEHISAINSVADIVVQLVATAGMLPDIAAAVTMRSTLAAVVKKLSAVQTVAEVVPLLEAVRDMNDEIRAALSVQTELTAVTAHLDAVRSLAAQLDILIQCPQLAIEAQQSAQAAVEAAGQISTRLDKAETARLGAELAEKESRTAATAAVTFSNNAAESARAAGQSAAAAAAVSGLADASRAAPGDPMVWSGTTFVMGKLADTLQSTDCTLGVSETVLETIATAQKTADGVDARATQAQTDAATAKSIAEDVDGKATQALTLSTTANELAQSARQEVSTFSGRLSAAENETLLLGESQNAHNSNGDLHHSTATLVERINTAVSLGLAELRDNGTGTLAETHNTLQKLADLLDAAQNAVDGFLFGENATDRMAMLNAIEANRATLANLQKNLLLKGDLVDSLDEPDAAKPLSANQGTVLLSMVNRAQKTADSAAVPWVQTLESLPDTWPVNLHSQGLLLICPQVVGDPGKNPFRNPRWYINDRNIPVPLTVDASGVRLADGTTVQTGVASTLVAAQAAQNAATAAQTAATQASADAASAKGTAEGIDAKATQAVEDATIAKTTAEGVDAKVTQAQADAAEAVVKATEALAKSPDLATQTTPGIVKGSDTVTVDAEGALHAASTLPLSSAVDSESETTAATSLAVKTAYDKAIEVYDFVMAKYDQRVIGIALVETGGGAGIWTRVDSKGSPVTLAETFFATHPVYSGIMDVEIDSQKMIRIPMFYQKYGIIAEGPLTGKPVWWISPDKLDESWTLHPAFMENGSGLPAIFVGKYAATSDGAKFGSQPGRLPAGDLNFPTMQSRCTARNTGGVSGFRMWDIYMLGAVRTLMLIEFATADMQAAVGAGRTQASSVGNVDASDVATASWRGLVGLWGNATQAVDGIRTNGSSQFEVWGLDGRKSYVNTGLNLGSISSQYGITLCTAQGNNFDMSGLWIPQTFTSAKEDGTFGYDVCNIAANCIYGTGGYYTNRDGAGLFAFSLASGIAHTNTAFGTRISKT